MPERFQFSPPAPREDIYFCLECKRINVRSRHGVRPYFSEYVSYGMLRFIRGRYGRQAKHGGMLAYVLDGDVASAIAGVESNIKARSQELGIQGAATLERCPLLEDEDRVRETCHNRQAGLVEMAIYHLFMPVDPEAAFRPVERVENVI